MEVSVITPVYNAAAYVGQAVRSALEQPETREVILIEDGSQDTSLQVCSELEGAFDRVRLLRHPDGKNLGAGASRNLGIRSASCKYIAFLDADDFYLPNRFAAARDIFARDPSADGVYGATGVFFEDEQSGRRWKEEMRGESMTTILHPPPPQQLFYALVSADQGRFTTDAIVVKRALFDKTGLFDEALRLHQDTAMWIKMAAVGKLVPGSADRPVAVRRVHAQNRFINRPKGYNPQKKLLDEILAAWGRQIKLNKKQLATLRYKQWRNSLFEYDEARREAFQRGHNSRIHKKFIFLVGRLCSSPVLLFSPCFPRFVLATLKGMFSCRP